jgi:hypothetical protein
VPQLQACEELPDELLHLIISLLCSFRDLLAFAATCRSWRAAFSSYPSKSTFCSVCPPLLVKLVTSTQAPHLSATSDARKLRTCKVIDPANENTTPFTARFLKKLLITQRVIMLATHMAN